MSGDRMSTLGSGIESLGIECPFWIRGLNVRESNVHFWVGDQKSGDQLSGDRMSGDRMSILGSGIESLGIECPFLARGSKVRGLNVWG